ncbi:MAG: hypothetical protein FWE37_03145 [Spirochaetaceae bacterium]|nr:hypothetical protein [Spirochaetaceae bacterium]
MKLIFLPVLFLFFILSGVKVNGQAAGNSTEEELTEEAATARTIFVPSFSYGQTSFDDVQKRNLQLGLTVSRFNLADRNRFLLFSFFYNPTFVEGLVDNYPERYHNGGMAFMTRFNRHTFNAAFFAQTDKPIYNGINTLIATAGYSNNVVNGQHFLLNIGLNLVLADVGVKLPNDMAWLLWPIPMVEAGWEYRWVRVRLSLLQRLVHLTVAPQSLWSLTANLRYPNYDITLWYRYLRNSRPAAELLGIGLGFKDETSRVTAGDGRWYGINYTSIYGVIRLFQLVEIHSGWVFNGRAGYNDSGLNIANAVNIRQNYDINIGQGFFFTISARMMF